MSQWKVFTIDGYFKNSWFSGDCNESAAKKPRQTPTLENLKAVFSNFISILFVQNFSTHWTNFSEFCETLLKKPSLSHTNFSLRSDVFSKLSLRKKLRNRANFVNLDTFCHNISHLFPHVALLMAWILHKFNVETPFYHMRNFLQSDCFICFCEKKSWKSSFFRVFRKFFESSASVILALGSSIYLNVEQPTWENSNPFIK